MSEDIKLIHTKDLIEELKNRFEVMVFGGYQTSVYLKDDVVYRRSWKGEHLHCHGLCNSLIFYINKEQETMSKPLPQGES